MEPSRYFVRRSGGLPVEAPIETEASPIFLDEGQPLVDFAAYWRIVRKHLRLVVSVVAAVVTLTMVKVMTETPLYEAETTIMIEPSAQGGGTDTLEKRLWRKAGIDPVATGGGAWYRDIGGGMGAALNAASAMEAYTLSDRGTWLSFNNKHLLVVVIEGDPVLLNRYDVILLDPVKHPGAKQVAARQLAEWLTSPEGQEAIGAYTIAGEQLFHPSASLPK